MSGGNDEPAAAAAEGQDQPPEREPGGRPVWVAGMEEKANRNGDLEKRAEPPTADE